MMIIVLSKNWTMSLAVFFVFLFLEKIFCIDAAGDAGSSGGYSDGNENGYESFISSSKLFLLI